MDSDFLIHCCQCVAREKQKLVVRSKWRRHLNSYSTFHYLHISLGNCHPWPTMEVSFHQRKLDNSAAAVAAKSLQSCLTLCNPIDGSSPGSLVPGILQARTLEWVAISFSNAWKWKVKVKSLSCVRLLVTPWTAAHQAPPSMGFSRQEYWSGVPLPSLDIIFKLP